MRSAELALRPGREGFHPADKALLDSPDVERIAIHHINQLDDGTIVFLYQLHGDLERAREIMGSHEDVISHSISGDGKDLTAYIHLKPNETVGTLFRLPQEYSVVVDTPIECLPDGGIRVRSLGDQETITQSLELIPENIDVELESMGEYHPDDRQLFSMLTDRQREILVTAITQGYYDVPRNATYEDIATEMDLAPVTVGEHLRKIESRVLKEIVPG
ncbi:MAG: helix-turn-helix domain-containing protein [Halorientalis sp.]